MAKGATRFLLLALVCGTTTYVASVAAQVRVPDAGRIQEQLRAPEPPRTPAQPQIRIEPPRGDAKAVTAPFYVASFRVRGATVFPEAQLAALLGEPMRAMTLAEVQALAERITDHYRKHGYIVARAIIPPQDVRDGVVEVRVVEGRYDRIDIANASEISERRIRGTVAGVREDSVVHGPALERAVLLLSDLAGIQPKATLEPAAQPGYTNLLLEISQTRATEFDAVLDNAGSRFTGRTRFSAGAIFNSPLKIGDRASARVIASEKLLSARLAYEAPLGRGGLRAGVYGYGTWYELGEDFASLDASGDTRGAGALLSYPFIRSTDLNVRLQFGGEARALEDRIGAQGIVNEKAIRVLQWGAGGDFRDTLLGGGITAFHALVSDGRVDLRTPELLQGDESTAGTQGGFDKFLLAVQRLQHVTKNTRLAINYTAQIASTNLDSSEKFSVGGPGGVRAYPSGEAAGDDVMLVQAELRYTGISWQGGQLTPAFFVDFARSRINHHTWPGFTGTNDRYLSALGLGVEWTRTNQFFARGWFARKLGDEPATADTDSDSRVWLQGGVLF